MGSHDLYSSAGASDAMQLANKPHHIGKMLDYVTADDFIKFIIFERVGQCSEVMNHVRLCARVGVDPDGAGKFVLTASDIKNSSRCRGRYFNSIRGGHWAWESVEQELCERLEVAWVNSNTQRLLKLFQFHSVQHDLFVAL